MKKYGWNGSMVLGRTLAISLASALLLIGTAMGEISRTGLVAEWHFDGDAKDSSGNGNEGVIHGASWVDGKFGEALSFDGVDDYLQIADSPTLDINSAITIEAWIYPKSFDQYRIILSKWYPKSYWFGCHPSGICGISITSDGAYDNGLLSTTSLSTNAWHHLVGTYDSSTGQMKVFIDGELDASKSTSGTIYSGTSDLWIGDNIGGPGQKFYGLIDEARIYNRTLSAGEVKANYEAGQIIVTSSISGDAVFVDGQFKGFTSPNLYVSGISPGFHIVKLRRSGYSVYETTVNVTAGEIAPVNPPHFPETTFPTPIPADISKIVEDELKKLVLGQILFNPPKEMTVGEKERVEVRIAQTITENLSRGLKGRGEPQIENISVGTLMKVQLTGDNFDIKPLSEMEQLVSGEGFTQWEYYVVPKESGTQSLELMVTVIIQLPNGKEKLVSLPVFDRTINVKVNPTYTLSKFMETNWEKVISIIIASGIIGWIAKNWRSRKRNS